MALKELLQGAAASSPVGHALPKLLRAIRAHLGMEVAFVSEFAGGRRVFRYVESGLGAQALRPGDGDPLEESYCARVVDGRLPELIQDAQALPEALALPATRAVPVGAHISVPIRLSDGSVYGTFCCLSRTADPSLGERDLSMMRLFAELAAESIDAEVEARRRRRDVEGRIRALLEGDGLTSVYQPIYDLRLGTPIGYESLSRFSAVPQRGPDAWFAEAASVGLGFELELRAIERALPALESLVPPLYLSANLSPKIPARSLAAVLERWPKARLVLEITEHEMIEEYEALAATLQPLRELGARVAVDDAGAGYASFRHILQLRPDFIKLDMSLTRGIDADPARRALAAALVRFAQDTGSEMIAEGVETRAELDALLGLGISKAQGYLLGRPAPFAEIAARREFRTGG